jgi:hypothetical protein
MAARLKPGIGAPADSRGRARIRPAERLAPPAKDRALTARRPERRAGKGPSERSLPADLLQSCEPKRVRPIGSGVKRLRGGRAGVRAPIRGVAPARTRRYIAARVGV